MIVKKFESTVNKYKDKVAVKGFEKSLTYKELNRIANCTARTIFSKCQEAASKPGQYRTALLFEKGIDEETLTSAKNDVKGQYPPRYETSGSLANLLTQMFVYDFDESFINTFQEKVDKLNIKKAKDIIRKYFPEENLQFVLIGKASEIKEAVSKYGEITEKEIKAEGF